MMDATERRITTARRRRMLDGVWGDDLREHLMLTLGIPRAENLGTIDTSVNLAKNVCEQVGGGVYAEEPSIRCESGDPTEMMALLEDLGLWSLAQRQGLYVYGLRESAYRVDWSESAQQVRVEIVTPELLEVRAKEDDPMALEVVKQMQMRFDPRTKQREPVWMVWDQPAGERYVEDNTGARRDDIAPAEPLPVYDGQAFLPWVLYHAAPTGHTWSPWGLSELFSAAFSVGVLWNGFHHAMRDASWKQKYALNARLASPATTRDGTASVVTSPTSVLIWESDTTGTLGVLDPAVDVEAYARAILTYQRTAVSSVGLHPDDIEQTGPESGVAIAIKRSATRRMTEAMEPQFRRGDVALLETIAKVSNVYGGTALPVEGWRIDYAHAAESISERVEAFEFHQRLVEAGLMSRTEWMMETFSGLTEEDAQKRLASIEVERAVMSELARRATQTPTPTPDNGDADE